MPAYKDNGSGKWYVQFYYTDWTGKRKKKFKRGFQTKKEAQYFESEFIRKASADMDMKLESFVEVYFKDKAGELKERSIRNKKYMIEAHVIPYLGSKCMNEIKPSVTKLSEDDPKSGDSHIHARAKYLRFGE